MATLPTANPPATVNQAGHLKAFVGFVRRLRDFLAHDHQPHGFTSDAFVARDLGIADPFPVLQMHFPISSPRLVVLLRFAIFIAFLMNAVSILFYYLIITSLFTICLFILAKYIHYKFAIGDGTFTWLWSKLVILAEVFTLHLFSMTSKGHRIDNPIGKLSCWFFWSHYLVFCFRPSRFVTNYLAAWKQRFPCEIMIFVDSTHESSLRVPCPPPQNVGLDDKYLMRYLYDVYNIYRIQRGTLAALVPKSLIRVEVIEVTEEGFAGKYHSTLDLGFDSYRQVALLESQDAMLHKKYLLKKLWDDEVIRVIDIHPPKLALNFVSGWDASAASYIILTPTVISIIVSIVWTAVAVRVYGADLQASVQTSTAVASYIVTASGLLIALAGWYDSILSRRQ